MASASDLLEGFSERTEALRHLGEWVEMLLKHLLREEGIRAHSVECRVKDVKSLEKKIAAKDGDYDSIDDITDCLGLRVITYFADDVDRVAGVIARYFAVDHIVDERSGRGGDPERFGYRSLHYVVRITADRATLPEWSEMGTQRFEIQLRSILQHAWAEIEHDLGYKAEEEVPARSRRRFSRLSGLLDTADDEFIGIRDELTDYRSSVDDSVATEPGTFAVDRDSLFAYVMGDGAVAGVDKQIATETAARLGPDPLDRALNRRVAEFRVLGLRTIADVDAALLQHRKEIAALARNMRSERKERGFLPRGISLLYLGYVLLITRNRTWSGVRRDLVATGRSQALTTSVLGALRKAWTRMRQKQPSLAGPRTRKGVSAD